MLLATPAATVDVDPLLPSDLPMIEGARIVCEVESNQGSRVRANPQEMEALLLSEAASVLDEPIVELPDGRNSGAIEGRDAELDEMWTHPRTAELMDGSPGLVRGSPAREE